MEEIQAGLRGVLRFLGFVGVVILFLSRAFWIHWFTKNEKDRLHKFSENTSRNCARLVRMFNIRVKVVNQPADHKPRLIVSNHMGFIDILCLASLNPMLFVTSHEMRETPVLGLLTEMAGCLFVERRSRTKILEELKTIAHAIHSGLNIVLYPEATSHNGERVLPFKRTLMMAAAHAKSPIQPVVFNFRAINGEEFTMKWRDHVCWYGDIPFHTAMLRALSLKHVDAEIEFLPEVNPSTDDDRGHLAEKVHAMIAAKFVPVRGAPVPQATPLETI